VRVVAFGVELDDGVAAFVEVGLPVPAVDLPAGCQVEVAVLPEADAHGVAEALGEGRDLAGAAVGAEVLEDEDPVGRLSLVVLGREMGVGLDDPGAALAVHGHARGRVEDGLRGDEVDDQPVVQGLGSGDVRLLKDKRQNDGGDVHASGPPVPAPVPGTIRTAYTVEGEGLERSCDRKPTRIRIADEPETAWLPIPRGSPRHRVREAASAAVRRPSPPRGS